MLIKGLIKWFLQGQRKYFEYLQMSGEETVIKHLLKFDTYIDNTHSNRTLGPIEKISWLSFHPCLGCFISGFANQYRPAGRYAVITHHERNVISRTTQCLVLHGKL